MEKLITFEVAKVLKEIGYPQGITDKCYLTTDHNHFYKEGQIVENEDGEWTVLTKNLADIPTYIEVWMWLWRVKKIYIDINCIQCSEYNTEVSIWHDYGEYQYACQSTDPEVAITQAIDYLVENKLLK